MEVDDKDGQLSNTLSTHEYGRGWAGPVEGLLGGCSLVFRPMGPGPLPVGGSKSHGFAIAHSIPLSPLSIHMYMYIYVIWWCPHALVLRHGLSKVGQGP
ncbi:unnamed protein product [Ilex paraguariensis]|uniref:Uncharacterized protein n=1 Tax=Ilex paraguariensis TaxID=185542 RepID=A0ABC8UBE8_9AQUA